MWTQYFVRSWPRFASMGVIFALGAAGSVTRGEEPARVSADGIWEMLDAGMLLQIDAEPWIQPERYQPVLVRADRLEASLAVAPMEFTQAAKDAPLVMTLPMPDGTFARFAVEESPIMEAPLAAAFPQIKTYRGRGLDDPAASVRFDRTPQGFHAQVLSPRGAVYIDPLFRGNTTLHGAYYKKDARRGGQAFECLTHADGQVTPPAIPNTYAGGSVVLRKYRLACAATGEYTQYHGGSVGAGLAAIVTAVNRVTGIYELEVAASLVLVANNAAIVYTSPSSDPYTNSDGFAMLGQNQSNLTSVIGSANYDIGHVFSTGGGGVASLRAVCSSFSKARGVTGLSSPTGDPFYVDYVAHEMGHQFGGNHSFNGVGVNCSGGNRNGSTAYEPGSGSTIMAYAGICGADNLQFNSDPYFHFISQQEIRSFITTGGGSSCASQVSSSNNPPTVGGGADYTIPAQTAFILTATGSDPDGDEVTYNWEERDLGPAQSLSSPDNGSSPIFRSFMATTDPTRTLPRLEDVLDGTLVAGEKYPTTSRTLRFRVTARDNNPVGGAFDTDDMQLAVVGTAGPFRVLTPAAGADWGGFETVTWDPAGTDVSPISAATVNILLSTDSGLTFPTVLLAGTPNDGEETVTAPSLNTTTARIKIEAVGNVFFDISDGDFSITPSCLGAANDPLAEAVPILKNRYLSFQPNNPGDMTAFVVTAIDLPAPFDALEGNEYFVSAPQSYPDGVGGSLIAATLGCTPEFVNWDGVNTVHVTGDAIVPGGVYDVTAARCTLDPGNLSNPLTVLSGLWGDVVTPFDPQPGQPNFADVSALADAFRGVPGALTRPEAQLQPNTPSPAASVSFQDISLGVDAFRGTAYPLAGPSTCP